MNNKNSQIKGKKLFLGIVILFGGVICILVPASTLRDRSLIAFVLMGIPLVMSGAIDIWESIEGLRKRKREGQENKDTKGQ
ncbi:hypothetical protein IMZ68_07340 [Candidatus Bathyarchaeota archaeon]|nr:hypothetical protein [Candidatus Bathyarchaeota archaeon]